MIVTLFLMFVSSVGVTFTYVTYLAVIDDLKREGVSRYQRSFYIVSAITAWALLALVLNLKGY